MDQMEGIVPAPFNSPDRADLVIQTSDGEYLFVRKVFLIQASVFFDNLFTDSSPDETHQDIPMYRVPEDIYTMCAVLRLCYPISDFSWDPVWDSLDFPVLPTLRKYIMEDAVTRLRAAVLNSDAIHNVPLRIFAIARQHGWHDITRMAARSFLSVSPRRQNIVEEMMLITALDYHYLLDYFWRCSDAVSKSLEDPYILPFSFSYPPEFGELVTYVLNPCQTCGVTPVQFSGRIPGTSSSIATGSYVCSAHPWIADTIRKMQRLLKDRPGMSLTSRTLVDDTVNMAQKQCRAQSYAGIRCLLQGLENSVGFVLAGIELKIDDEIDSMR